MLSSESLKANIFGTNGAKLSGRCSFLLLIRSFNSVNVLPFPITFKISSFDITWTRPSITFMSLFLIYWSSILITSFANQYLAFLKSVLLYVSPMWNKNYTFNIACIPQLLPSMWGVKVFGCNDVRSLLLISQKATDKKILFQTCQFSFFTKRIKMNGNFFFQINNCWKPMTAIYNWDYDSAYAEWYLSNSTSQKRLWRFWFIVICEKLTVSLQVAAT